MSGNTRGARPGEFKASGDHRKGPLGYVYFIRCPDHGLVKIGYSATRPDGRLAALRNISPAPLEPMGYRRGRVADEKAIQRDFAAHWSHGEWFRESEPLARYVAAHCLPWGASRVGFVAPFRRTARMTYRDWAKNTYARIHGEWLTVHHWSRIARARPSLVRVKSLLESGAEPEDIFFPRTLEDLAAAVGSRKALVF